MGISTSQKSTGDLALWWEAARDWRLGRRWDVSDIAARRPARNQIKQASSRGRHRQSQGLVFLGPASGSPFVLRPHPVGLLCHQGTASGEPASTTDEKPALASAGLTDQVELCHSYPPSSLDEVAERPGQQPRGLPDLPQFTEA